MADLVTLTIDNKQVKAPVGTLVIDAAKAAGILIPSFCYYPGLSLQGACRMCLVEVEKFPKLQTACTLPVAEGMVVRTDTEVVHKARKSMVEFLLTNHPLDCPVCDKGGECELQDMSFRYGLGESRFIETKQHVDEKQWSPIVFYDAPRCILCYRCVRICNEGMGVAALGIEYRGVASEIAPNKDEHLECDECGMCIDICPVGALTSGTYRYQTRPWEMKHVGTICTHCADGCKTTLGLRNGEITRCNNRDASGINGEFLCVKGRYGFDFETHPERLQAPLMRVNGKLEETSWAKALVAMVSKFREVKERSGQFGIIGSNHTTNEENYFLQKLARQGLGTNNIDHHRTGDVASLIAALAGRADAMATVADLYSTKASLIVGADLSQQHSMLAFQLRANFRHHNTHTYAVTAGPTREEKQAIRAIHAKPGEEMQAVESLRDQLKAEPELVILFGDAVRGEKVRQLVAFGDSLGIPVKYVCLVDYSNSRGASDMGLLPNLAAGYQPVENPGLTLPEMLASDSLDLLWVVGANPLKNAELTSKAFVVVQDMFLTETAQKADIVLPASSAYEKTGTVTNVTGETQRLTAGASCMGTKPDLDIFGILARELKLDLGPARVEHIREEIRKLAHGNAAAAPQPELIRSAGDTLYTSGTLGRYSKMVTSVLEYPGELYKG